MSDGSLNSIETLDLETGAEWKALALNNEVQKGFNLVGVSFQSRIVMFGGPIYAQ